MNYFNYQAAKANMPAKTYKPVSTKQPRNEFNANRALAAAKRSI